MTYLSRIVTEPSEFWPDYRETWQVVDMHGNRPRFGFVTISTFTDSFTETALEKFNVRWHDGVMWQSEECYYLEDAHDRLKSQGFELIDRVNLD